MDLSKFAAVIPARGGSKGIHKKNIVITNGKPLIFYTIMAAQNVFPKENIFVSTDSDEISEISKKYGARVPYLRPKEISDDTSSSVDLIEDFFFRYPKYEHIVLLQPTSPLRKSNHIKAALNIYINNRAKCCISVKEDFYQPNYYFKKNEKKLLINETIPHDARQIAENRLYPNGAIYISTKNNILNRRSFFTDETFFYLMDKISSIDIDDKDDLKIAELLLKK
tara:strand:+ start:655 stop:1326 length:672 start_codon:yes stop_codon:yes gene_type:complete